MKKYIGKLNLKRVSYPVSIAIIKKFETDNKNLKPSIRINVYTFGEVAPLRNSIIPIYISKKSAESTIKLLLIKNHFYYIKNFNRLMSNYESIYHHYCFNCITGFRNKEKLKKHIEICRFFKPTVALMPNKNQLHKKEISKMSKFNFAVYCDFESILEKDSTIISNKTEITQKHRACGYAIIVIENDFDVYYQSYYRGKDCMKVFIKDLRILNMKIQAKLFTHMQMLPLSMEQEDEFLNADKCYLCDDIFLTDPLDRPININERKVHDHCHYTGIYRGAAHSKCNIEYRQIKKLPVYFHNLKGYDSHFIISSLSDIDFLECKIVPYSMEKFITFSLDDIQVMDSFQFLSESLEKLVDNLRNSNYDFPITRKVFEKRTNNESQKIRMLLQKSFYPYDYMDNFDKFQEKKLPPYKYFYSKLNNTNITEENYDFAQNVWNVFDMKSIGDYHNFYVLLDTALLADVFQAFRKTIFNVYKLDPCHFFSIPGLAWSAALKYIGKKIELFTDIDMYQFIERGIRGGISGVMKRHSIANNAESNTFNENEESKYLCYLDVNNLYGWAMNQNLPCSDFEWIDGNELSKIDWQNINTETNVGYIIEIDLIYPKELHDLHKDFPLCPERMKIPNTFLSKYQIDTLELLKKYGYRRTATEKLMLTLFDKTNYVLHFKNLKLYLQLGMKIQGFHRGIKFHQSKVLSPYIKLNTKLRKQAKNDFEKDLFKLMNNSVFGKSIQDNRKHLNVILAMNEKQAENAIRKPTFEQFNIIDENKAIIKMKKPSIKLDKPIFIGFTVLELSKHLMYDYKYNLFQKYYGDKIQLCYTDTDSFIFEIQSNTFIEELKNVFGEIMDFSNFKTDHPYFDNKNMKKIGLLKSETGEKTIHELVAIKSKLYSVLYGEDQKKCTAKGLQKSVLKKFINHNHYLNVIENNSAYITKMKRIQSKNHQLQTIKLNKMIFTAFDDKRYILDDGLNTLPFGHYSIKY